MLAEGVYQSCKRSLVCQPPGSPPLLAIDQHLFENVQAYQDKKLHSTVGSWLVQTECEINGRCALAAGVSFQNCCLEMQLSMRKDLFRYNSIHRRRQGLCWQ